MLSARQERRVYNPVSAEFPLASLTSTTVILSADTRCLSYGSAKRLGSHQSPAGHRWFRFIGCIAPIVTAG
jgi:hypothetical protein